MRAASALATPGNSSAAPGLSMVRNSGRGTTWVAIWRDSCPPRGMSHYSRGGGDPNIVQHGGHRRHAPVTATRDRMRGSDMMAKIPLTFACGLYDRMLALYTGEVQAE